VTDRAEALHGLGDQQAARQPGGPDNAPLLATEGLSRHFSLGGAFRKRTLHAVDDVSLTIGEREIVALAGESGSGKSTIAMAVERELFARGYFVYVLDGDNVRAGLNRDLGFSRDERKENIRRVGEVAALFADAGAIVIAGTISPHAADRAAARAAAKPGAFHEIYVRASVETCAARDVKGHYARARAGELPDFTGVSAPYEEPEQPELLVDTNASSIEASVSAVVEYLIRVATAPEALLSYSI